MTKINLSFDIDDVIVDDTPFFKAAFKNTEHEFRYPTGSNLRDIPNDVCKKIIKSFSEPDIYLDLPLLDDRIPDAINSLINNDDFNISFITARPQEFFDLTIKSLNEFGIQISNNNLYCVGRLLRYQNPESAIAPAKKIDIIKKLNIDTHFEDGDSHIMECLHHNITPIMISNHMTPYNHHLRDCVEHYPNLIDALIAKGFY